MDRTVKLCRIFLYLLSTAALSFFIVSTTSLSQVYAASQQDTEPPTTNVSLSGNWNGHYFTSSVEVSISAVDNPSGQWQKVKYTAYRINSGSWTPYTDPFVIQNEGVYTLSYFSEDYNGNPEQAKTTQFEINSNMPTSTPEPTQIVFATPTPTPTSIAAPTSTLSVSPSAVPTKTPTPILQSYPASYPYYRSPTKTPTPTPTKIQKDISNKTVVNQITPDIASPTPTVRIVNTAENVNNNEEPAILGQSTNAKKSEPEQQSNNPLILILAFITFGTYVFGVHYFYKKLKKKELQ